MTVRERLYFLDVAMNVAVKGEGENTTLLGVLASHQDT